MSAKCPCRKCIRAEDAYVELFHGTIKIPTEMTIFIVCPICGNKRCPHANDHDNACTNSNDVGQPGSAWADVKPFSPSIE